MADFPLPLADLLGHWGSYSVYALVGLAFGWVLESAGFGNSKLLAAQFYFRDMRVFKVMFTAIITAMTLVFLASSVGLLDYNLVWVPPTYLWPGIVGGLIMGLGFIVGGFCPGTSLVGAATGKLDALFFVAGVLFGIYLFGETVSRFDVFFESSYMGRFTLPEWLGLSYGTVVIAVVVMALVMFVLAEKAEARINRRAVPAMPGWLAPAAAVLVVLAGVTAWIGQPGNRDRWEAIAADQQPLIDNRDVYIAPQELLSLIGDAQLKAMLLDVRKESDFNQFHILGAQRVPPDRLQTTARELLFQPANTVFVVMSNGESAATEAWKTLRAESLPNVYILAGGVNRWVDTFAAEPFRKENALQQVSGDQLAWRFPAATGSRHPAAEPNPYVNLDFEPKVKLEIKRAPSGGGCG
jgi:rhodanese-related sulfurtransferase